MNAAARIRTTPPATGADPVSQDVAIDSTISIDREMERISMFMPNYLDDLVTLVAKKQGVGKATIIRDAILKELDRFIQDLVDRGSNLRPDEPLVGLSSTPNLVTWIEGDDDASQAIYVKFVENRDKFPGPAGD